MQFFGCICLSDCSAYQEWMEKVALRNDTSLPIRASVIFEMFPFCMLFNVRSRNTYFRSNFFKMKTNKSKFESSKLAWSTILFQDEMTVMCLGAALRLILPQTIGKKINSYFELIKPLVEFKFDTIIAR